MKSGPYSRWGLIATGFVVALIGLLAFLYVGTPPPDAFEDAAEKTVTPDYGPAYILGVLAVSIVGYMVIVAVHGLARLVHERMQSIK